MRPGLPNTLTKVLSGASYHVGEHGQEPPTHTPLLALLTSRGFLSLLKSIVRFSMRHWSFSTFALWGLTGPAQYVTSLPHSKTDYPGFRVPPDPPIHAHTCKPVHTDRLSGMVTTPPSPACPGPMSFQSPGLWLPKAVLLTLFWAPAVP